MLKDDVATRLVALKEQGPPKSLAALVRELFDEIEETLKRVKLPAVVAELNQAGVSVELSGFRTAYYRVKRERRACKQAAKSAQPYFKDMLICPHCGLTLTKDGQPLGEIIAKLPANSESVRETETASSGQPEPVRRMSDLYRR